MTAVLDLNPSLGGQDQTDRGDLPHYTQTLYHKGGGSMVEGMVYYINWKQTAVASAIAIVEQRRG